MPAYLNRTGASRSILAAAALALAVVSSACKKDTTAPLQMAATNTSLNMNSTITSVVAGKAFSFPGGAGALSSEVANQNLALTFAGTAAAPTASMTITSPTGGAVGSFSADVTFGSCIFKITASTFTGTSALAQGKTITVDPCKFEAITAGKVANGTASAVNTALLLGNFLSGFTPLTISIGPSGTITINGVGIGTVALTPVSG